VANVLLKAAPLSKATHRFRDLAGYLAHFDYEVYPREAVVAFQDAYRIRMVDQMCKEKKREHLFELAFFASCVLGVLFIGGGFHGLRGFAAFVILLFCRSLHSTYLDSTNFIRYELRWWSILVEPQEIPKSVPHLIHRAKVLRRHLPSVTFSIDTFALDPFLWAHWKGQSYCIGHWDEPEFEG
jgi:hypothetical protein